MRPRRLKNTGQRRTDGECDGECDGEMERPRLCWKEDSKLYLQLLQPMKVGRSRHGHAQTLAQRSGLQSLNRIIQKLELKGTALAARCNRNS